MPFEATPTAGRRIIRKAKDNSPIREQNPDGSTETGASRVKNSYLKMYLPSGSQGSPSAWKLRCLPPKRVCAPLAALSGDVEIARGARGCSHSRCYPRVRVCKHGGGAPARPKEPASPFPELRRGLSNLSGTPHRGGRELQPLWSYTTLAVDSIVTDWTTG